MRLTEDQRELTQVLALPNLPTARARTSAAPARESPTPASSTADPTSMAPVVPLPSSTLSTSRSLPGPSAIARRERHTMPFFSASASHNRDAAP